METLTTSMEYNPEIMSWDAYAKIKHDTPYVFELKKADKQLTYFGTTHTSDPLDPMFDQIRAKFSEIQPDSVFVEGMEQLEELKKDPQKWAEGVAYIKGLSEDDVIRKYGEPGFGLKLAIEADVAFYSPEPKFSDEILSLLKKGFTKEEIFADFAYRQIYQYYRDIKNRNMPIEEYLQSGIIEDIKRNTNWDGFDYSVSNLEKIGEAIWGNKADIRKEDFCSERTNPNPGEHELQTRITQVAQESSHYRDVHMVRKMKEALISHNKPFVIFGSSHAYMQRPALEKMFAEM